MIASRLLLPTLALALSMNTRAATPLSRDVTAKIDTRLASANPDTAKPIFSKRDDGASSYIRNPNCWAYGLDLTPLCVWNSNAGAQQSGVLISPRHVVCAEHFQYGTGTRLRWVTNDNQVIERQVTNSARVGNTDIHLCLLSSAVPNTVSFAKVLPPGYATKLPLAGLPVVYTDQEKKALVADVKSVTNSIVNVAQPASSRRAAFYELWISGDSGSGALLFVRSQPVILLTATEPTSGPDYSGLQESINTVMTQLGGGYQLTTASLATPPKPKLEQSGAFVLEPKQ